VSGLLRCNLAAALQSSTDRNSPGCDILSTICDVRSTSFPAVRLLATNVSFGRIEPTGDRKPADGPPDGAVRGLLVLDYSVRYGPIAVERYRPNVVHLRNVGPWRLEKVNTARDDLVDAAKRVQADAFEIRRLAECRPAG
jgi:hypothetical protein